MAIPSYGDGTYGDLEPEPAPTALIGRVRARVETDLPDDELNAMIAEATATITSLYGPVADTLKPIVVLLDGDRRRLNLMRPADATQPLSVTEQRGQWSAFEPVDASEYTLRNNGRTLERLTPGDLGFPYVWGDRVTVAYVPVDDSAQRDEVTIGLVSIGVQERSLKSLKAGDLTTEWNPDLGGERDRLLASLAPRRGLMML